MESTHTRTSGLAPLICATALVLLMLGRLSAGEEARADEPAVQVASDEKADSCLAAFEVAFKARGLKGDDRMRARALALVQLAQIQHPDVVDVLAKHTRDEDPDVRITALVQLGKQRAFPGYAGKAVLAAVHANPKDAMLVLASLDCIAGLGYLGGSEWLVNLIKLSDYAVAKRAVTTAAQLGDARLTGLLVDLLKEMKLEEGFRWDGYSASWATGSADDVSREEAERIRSEGEARAKKGKARRKERSGRTRDMGAHVLEALLTMTQEKFTGGSHARAWLRTNAAKLKADMKAIRQRDEAQQKTAKALKSRRRPR